METGLYVEDDVFSLIDGEDAIHRFRPQAKLATASTFDLAQRALTKNGAPDWVVMDFRFPGTRSLSSGGFELLRYLEMYHPEVLVICVSETSQEVIAKTLQAENVKKRPDVFFTKPPNFSHVLEYLESKFPTAPDGRFGPAAPTTRLAC